MAIYKVGINGASGLDGVTPEFKVEEGNLFVSYDEGTTWKSLGTIKGADGVTPVFEVSSDGYWVINGEKTEYKAIGVDGGKGAPLP